jgi:hypothetical protein
MQAKQAADGALASKDVEKWNRIGELTDQGRRMDALGFGLSSEVENLQRLTAYMANQYLDKVEQCLSVGPFGEDQLVLASQ